MPLIDEADHDVHDFVIKKGARDPDIEAILTDDDGDEIDLSGATVKLRMSNAIGESPVVDDTCIVEPNAQTGHVVYQWRSGDTDTAGHFKAEFLVDYSGGTGTGFEVDERFPSDDYLSFRVMEGL